MGVNQGGKGHKTENCTGTQSFTTKLSYSLALKPRVLLLNLISWFQTGSVKTCWAIILILRLGYFVNNHRNVVRGKRRHRTVNGTGTIAIRHRVLGKGTCSYFPLYYFTLMPRRSLLPHSVKNCWTDWRTDRETKNKEDLKIFQVFCIFYSQIENENCSILVKSHIKKKYFFPIVWTQYSWVLFEKGGLAYFLVLRNSYVNAPPPKYDNPFFASTSTTPLHPPLPFFFSWPNIGIFRA